MRPRATGSPAPGHALPPAAAKRRLGTSVIHARLWLCLLACSTIAPLCSALQTQPPAAAAAPATAGHVSAEQQLKAATEALEVGNAPAALARAQAVAQQAPNTPGVQYVLGSALYRLGRMVEAEHALRSAVAAAEGNTDAVRLLGLSLYRLGRPKEALTYLQRTQGTGPRDSDAAYILGMCYVQTGDLEQARAAFASQYDYPKDSAAAFLLEAQLLLRENLLPAAETEGEQALRRNPHLALAHYLLGEIALARQDIPHALEHFHAEIENNPGYSRTFDRLGDAYIREGDLGSAQAALNRAIILDPAQTGPYILLGKLMLRKSDPATAILYLRRAEKMDMGNYTTHALLGQALRATKQTEEASREMRIAADLQRGEAPKLPDLR